MQPMDRPGGLPGLVGIGGKINDTRHTCLEVCGGRALEEKVTANLTPSKAWVLDLERHFEVRGRGFFLFCRLDVADDCVYPVDDFVG